MGLDGCRGKVFHVRNSVFAEGGSEEREKKGKNVHADILKKNYWTLYVAVNADSG